MKVILLQDVENLGKKYEVKEVPDGYARNFLIPKELVKPVTKESLLWLEKQKEIAKEKAEGELKKIQKMASALDGQEIEFILKTGEEGQLFESINQVKLAKKLTEMGFNVKKDQIELKEPIKEIGEFPVKIALDQGLEVEVMVIVIPEPKEEEEEEEKEE